MNVQAFFTSILTEKKSNVLEETTIFNGKSFDHHEDFQQVIDSFKSLEDSFLQMTDFKFDFEIIFSDDLSKFNSESVEVFMQLYRESQHDIDRKHKQICIMLILYVLQLNEMSIHSIFDDGDNQFGFLFDPDILPINPKKSWTPILIKYINDFLFNELNTRDVFSLIHQYIYSLGPNEHVPNHPSDDNIAIYNFLPLLLKVLDSDDKLIKRLIDSNLIIAIVTAAKNEIIIFDYLRILLLRFPVDSINNIFIVEHLQFYFYDEMRSHSVCEFLNQSIEFISQNAQNDDKFQISLFDNVGRIFVYFMDNAIDKSESQITSIYKLHSCIAAFLSSQANESKIEAFLNSFAKYVVHFKSRDAFDTIINQIANTIKTDSLFLLKLRKFTSFFTILKNYKGQFTLSNLINLSLYKNGDIDFIQLSEVIELILSLILNMPNEQEELLNKLLALSNNEMNVIELYNAKVVNFILDNFISYQNESAIRENYLKLLSTITCRIYDHSILYKTIELLQNPELHFHNEILNHIKNGLDLQLKSDDHFLSFFRFDCQSSCGISIDDVIIKSGFSFSFKYRYCDPTTKTRLVYFTNPLSNFGIYLENQQLYVDTKSTLGPIADLSYDPNKWHSITFELRQDASLLSFIYKGYWTLILNGQIITKKLEYNCIDHKNTIYICREPPQDNVSIYQSSLCDISEIVFDNELRIDPIESYENTWFNNVAQKYVKYSGKSISNISTIYNIFDNMNTIPILMPLFDIHQISMQSIASIFALSIKVNEQYFIKSRFFELLASFLYNCPQNKINSESILAMYDILSFAGSLNYPNSSEWQVVLKNEALYLSFINSILFNYYIPNKFESVCSSFFESSPLNDENWIYSVISQIPIDDLSFILNRTIEYYSNETKESDYAWRFLLKLSRYSVNDHNISILLKNLCLNDNSEYTKQKILEIINAIYEKVDQIKYKHLSDLKPFVIVSSKYPNSKAIRILVLEIIANILKVSNMDFNLISQGIYYLLMSTVFPNELTDITLITIISLQLKQLLPYFVVNLQQNPSTELALQYIEILKDHSDNFSISSIKLWEYWITNLFLFAYSSAPDFASNIIDVINQNDLLALMNFFDCVSSNQFDFQSVKRYLINELVKNDGFLSNSINYSYVFNFLLVVIKSTAVSQTIFKHIQQFCPTFNEIFVDINIDINFITQTIHSEKTLSLNKAIAVTVLSKTTNLNNIQLQIGNNSFTVHQANEIIKKIYIDNSQISSDLINKLSSSYETFSKDLSNDYLNRLSEFIVFAGIKNENILTDKDFVEQLLFCIDQQGYEDLFVNSQKYIINRNDICEREMNHLLNLKKSFLNTVKNVPGVWEDKSNKSTIKRYKVLNYVSKNGQKNLMKINHHYTKHEDATFRSQKDQSEENDLHIPVYKMDLQPFDIDQIVFNASVTLTKLCILEDCTLQASKSFICIIKPKKKIWINWNDVEFILNRRYGHIPNSCEIFTKSGRSYFISFFQCERQSFYNFIRKNKIMNSAHSNNNHKFSFFDSLRSICNDIYQNKEGKAILFEMKLTEKWRNRLISNYEYLYYLNMLSGRSFQDLSQYPIFPFLLINSESNELDLNQSSSYRDLSKQLPFYCIHRVRESLDKYAYSEDFSSSPYLFAETPSSMFFAIWYLFRAEPYTTLHVSYAQGSVDNPRFDCPDRMFLSIESMVDLLKNSVSTSSKETTPEFFNLPAIFVNENDFDLGVTSNDVVVNDLQFPNWCSNAFSFTTYCRIMLESHYCDENLNKWIDSLFGVDRRVYKDSNQSYFIYQQYAYPEIEVEPGSDFSEQIEQQSIKFGKLPEEIFDRSHPPRRSFQPKQLHLFKTEISFENYLIKKNLIYNKFDNYGFFVKDELEPISLPKYCGDVLDVSARSQKILYGTLKESFLTVFHNNSVHIGFRCSSIITSATIVHDQFLITGGNDSALRVWDFNTEKEISSSSFHSSPICTICCSYDLGLIVSLDHQSTLVYETLSNHTYLTSVSLNEVLEFINKFSSLDNDIDENSCEYKNIVSRFVRKEGILFDVNKYKDFLTNKLPKLKKNDKNSDTFLLILKSGTVAVVIQSMMLLLDCHGRLLTFKQFEYKVIQVSSYYGHDGREFLLIGTKTFSKKDKIFVYDIASTSCIVKFLTYYNCFYPVKDSYQCRIFYKKTNSMFSFQQYIPTTFKPTREQHTLAVSLDSTLLFP